MGLETHNATLGMTHFLACLLLSSWLKQRDVPNCVEKISLVVIFKPTFSGVLVGTFCRWIIVVTVSSCASCRRDELVTPLYGRCDLDLLYSSEWRVWLVFEYFTPHHTLSWSCADVYRNYTKRWECKSVLLFASVCFFPLLNMYNIIARNSIKRISFCGQEELYWMNRILSIGLSLFAMNSQSKFHFGQHEVCFYQRSFIAF